MFVANFIYLQQECCGSEISRATLVLNLLWESLDGKGQFLMNLSLLKNEAVVLRLGS
jgi:hypothetical protein